MINNTLDMLRLIVPPVKLEVYANVTRLLSGYGVVNYHDNIEHIVLCNIDEPDMIRKQVDELFVETLTSMVLDMGISVDTENLTHLLTIMEASLEYRGYILPAELLAILEDNTGDITYSVSKFLAMQSDDTSQYALMEIITDVLPAYVVERTHELGKIVNSETPYAEVMTDIILRTNEAMPLSVREGLYVNELIAYGLLPGYEFYTMLASLGNAILINGPREAGLNIYLLMLFSEKATDCSLSAVEEHVHRIYSAPDDLIAAMAGVRNIKC